MKRILLAALGLGGMTGYLVPVHAQSNVTLYGIVDAGVGYTSGQRTANSKGGVGAPINYTNGSNWGFASGTWSGDRWGLKGSEDLGGGNAAIFQLENGFNIGNGTMGQGSRLFGRQAWMGLQSATLGKLTFGRQYDPIVDYVGPISAGTFVTGMGAHPGDIDNQDNQARVNNSVKWASPVYGGFQFGAIYGFGGQPGSVKNQNTWGVGGQYASGPIAFGVGYLQATNAYGTSTSTWSGSYDGTFASSINEGFASAASQRIFSAAGSYTFGATQVGIQYGNVHYTPGALSTFASGFTFNSIGTSVAYQLTPALRLAAAYNFTQGSDVKGTGGPKYHTFNLATYYALSKRTSLYGLVGYQKASGSTLDTFGNVVSATASVGDVGNGISSATATQTIFRMGIRQTF
ncbi:porin [Pandoraea apista]|uniref:Porin n=1 Tax=Pandoraea apista TaxID=93218 RepID=A0A0G4JKP5_9BURK|nr:porin [Pandoraea apista]AVF40957.1 porin [Pandoraea apista]OXS88571.1 porin [Pandoraea apista]RRW99423.1 porin [Pandoraea apista]RRX07740.1 porin [Pandoraea apista]